MLALLLAVVSSAPPCFDCVVAQSNGHTPVSITINLTVSLESIKLLTFNVTDRGDGEVELVASVLETGSPDARKESQGYAIALLGAPGLLKVAALDRLEVSIPDGAVAYRLDRPVIPAATVVSK